MPHVNFEQMEREVRVRCRVTWPSTVGSGFSFRRNIGRTLNRSVSVEYSIPAFPISLIRDTAAFEAFCGQHLPSLHAQVGGSWDLNLNLEVNNVVQRVLLPPVNYGSKCGPFPPDALPEMHKTIANIADLQWAGYLQHYYVTNVATVEATGITSHALHEVYRWFWAVKDGPNSNSPSVDGYLRTEYLQLARSAMGRGDDETAAQYSRIVFDLSPNQNVTDELLSEFNHLTGRWSALAVVRENAVKKVATVAREGVAEWWRFATFRCYRSGLISPLTEELKEYYSSYEVEKDREKLLKRRPTNPYRRGLELAEAVENGLGLGALLLWGIVTEWPLEALRLRVPAYVVERIQNDSPLAPDTRAAKLAELSHKTVGKLSSPQMVMPMLHGIHRHLDESVPGTMTSALCQLEIEKGRKL